MIPMSLKAGGTAGVSARVLEPSTMISLQALSSRQVWDVGGLWDVVGRVKSRRYKDFEPCTSKCAKARAVGKER